MAFIGSGFKGNDGALTGSDFKGKDGALTGSDFTGSGFTGIDGLGGFSIIDFSAITSLVDAAGAKTL